jgi:hypothetical protein
MRDGDATEVLYVDNAMVADPMVRWLQAHGIDAWLADPDDLGGLDPALAFVHATGIVVATRDAVRARNLLAAFQQATIAPTPELAGDEV